MLHFRTIFTQTANNLIKDILAELRYSLRNLDKPSQRRIKRSYGVIFDVKEEEVEKEIEKKEEEVEKEGENGEEVKEEEK